MVGVVEKVVGSWRNCGMVGGWWLAFWRRWLGDVGVLALWRRWLVVVVMVAWLAFCGEGGWWLVVAVVVKVVGPK